MLSERLPSTIGKVYPADHPDVKANPELAGKNMPNIVSITNNVRNKADTKEGQKVLPVEIAVPAEQFEYNQFENFDEFIAECGGTDKALEVLNDVKRNAATAAGKSAIRMATTGTVEEMIALGLRTCKNHTFKTESTISTKDKAARFDELQVLAAKGDVSPEELMRRVLELSKI